MKFSDFMKKYIAENRNPDMIIISDKLRVREYVKKKIGENNFFSHRIYEGYNIDNAINAIKIPCVLKMNNAWRRMIFFYKMPGK